MVAARGIAATADAGLAGADLAGAARGVGTVIVVARPEVCEKVDRGATQLGSGTVTSSLRVDSRDRSHLPRNVRGFHPRSA